ncbi:MAG TPA: aspartate carbamoyltransferase catalytic subunit [bacterium]|nr:aspartate carbamoyltransferase catalytic subunit [bacterium]HQO33514.1 aspartate carbamoyltransferase catalytic subunit [bacterium]HQP99020.1 aspartate carbamoyltransferase catalytic subunit [bacterium]
MTTKFPYQHLLGLRGIPRETIELILDTSRAMKEVHSRKVKKVPTLRGKIVVNLFYEPSTRTRTSFELAAKRLSADTVSISTTTSSVVKGESLLDTAHTLRVMGADIIIMRHSSSGAPHLLAENLNISIINAGDGINEHPTQGLLDLFTIREHKGQIQGLTVTIAGDVRHSRVARSNMWGLLTLGARVRMVGPPTLVPKYVRDLGVEVYTDFDKAIDGADVVNLLRIQKERMTANFFPNLREYNRLYGMSSERLANAKSGVLIMHPGPINRGVEISSEVADGPSSVILEQVTNGIAVRMAVLYLLVTGQRERSTEEGASSLLWEAES